MATISQIITTGEPYIRSYRKQNIIQNILSNDCTGFIDNVTLDGGSAPYEILWRGPSGYTATTLDNYNLCGGVYSGTVTDTQFSAHTSVIFLDTQPAPTLSATTIDSGCTTNINQFCKIKVHQFTHTQPTFTYILYKDGAPYKDYIGSTGNEIHTFTNLSCGSYALSAYDGIEVDIQYLINEAKCSDGYFLDSDVFGGTGSPTIFTGLTPQHIVEEWNKTIKFTDSVIPFRGGAGPNSYSGFGFTIYYDTGLISGGTIETNNPDAWFYTGSTATRRTDKNEDWFLGTSALTMTEGANIGPVGLSTLADIGKFYYNSFIKKFVVNYRATPFTNSWVTYNPTEYYGVNGNPVASQLLTGTSYYNTTTPLGTLIFDYTVTADTNTVIRWDSVTAGNSVFLLDGNVGIPIGNSSTCYYGNYSHEVTLGSSAIDNDLIGIVLASSRDELGLYGEVNHTHNLILWFKNTSSASAVGIQFNYADRTNGFVGSNGIRHCGNPSNPCTTAYSGYSSTITTRPVANSPFSIANFNTQGTTRVKIERKGLFGERFRIRMTDLITGPSGGVIPYNSTYEMNLNLLDKSTWSGETASAPSYVDDLDLIRFLGGQQIGYYQSSQADSRFFHISFSGHQSNNLSTVGGYGASATQLFPFCSYQLRSMDMSNTTNQNYWKSIGGGGVVGKSTVPVAQPIPQITMETIEEPKVVITKGGTKVTVPSTDIVIIDPKDYREKCLELGFEWQTHTDRIQHNVMLAGYALYGYKPEDQEFSKKALQMRFFDKLSTTIQYIKKEDNEVIGEGVAQTDCLPFNFLNPNICEYGIKPIFLTASVLDQVVVEPGTITALVEDACDPNTSSTWLSTLDVNADDDSPYGNFNIDKDFYFAQYPSISKPNLLTNTLDYGAPRCSNELINKQVTVVPYPVWSGDTPTTGSTEQPYLVEGKPFAFTLDYNCIGTALQVTLNGVTQTQGQVGVPSYGDYTFTNPIVTFFPDTLAAEDEIQVIYMPDSNRDSYHFNSYVVPPVIPSISATTSATTLTQNGFFYFYTLDEPVLGIVGMVLNGIVLTDGEDYKLISNNKVQLLSVTYPGGLVEGDILSFFYITQVDVLGLARHKEPVLEVGIRCSPNYDIDLTCNVLNTRGKVVYTYTNTLRKEKCINENVSRIEYKLKVPGPGTYSYHIISTSKYMSITGLPLTNSFTSDTYMFNITPAVYYSVSGGDDSGTTPTSQL